MKYILSIAWHLCGCAQMSSSHVTMSLCEGQFYCLNVDKNIIGKLEFNQISVNRYIVSQYISILCYIESLNSCPLVRM